MRIILPILAFSSLILAGCLQNPPTNTTPIPPIDNSGIVNTGSNITDSRTTDTGTVSHEGSGEIEKEISIEPKTTQSGSKEAEKAIDDSLKAIDNLMGN